MPGYRYRYTEINLAQIREHPHPPAKLPWHTGRALLIAVEGLRRVAETGDPDDARDALRRIERQMRMRG